MDAYDDQDILSRYSMTRRCLINVIDIVKEDFSHDKKISCVLSLEEQPFAALSFYGTGSFQQVIVDILGFSQPSVSRSVQRVSTTFTSIAGKIIKFSTDNRKAQVIKEGFMVKFRFPSFALM